MGRLREVCGAVSGMFLVLGLVQGYDSPADACGKAVQYARVQKLARQFRDENGSIVCRELLGLAEHTSCPCLKNGRKLITGSVPAQSSLHARQSSSIRNCKRIFDMARHPVRGQESERVFFCRRGDLFKDMRPAKFETIL